MKWFYDLKKGVRVAIAVVAWLPLLIFAGIIGATGKGEDIAAWEGVVAVVLLAVPIFFDVFAARAAARDKASENAQNQAATPPQVRPAPSADVWSNVVATARPVRPVTVSAPSFNEIGDGYARAVDDASATFAETPDFTAKLTRVGSSDVQDNITSCEVGDAVLLEYDDEKDAFECVSSGGEIGYLPARAVGGRRGRYLIKIDEIPYDEESDKYGVVIGAYPLSSEDRAVAFPIHTKIRGVTFEGRQAYLSESHAGDVLIVRHAPTAEYPDAIVVVNVRTGKTLGNIGNDLAASLLASFGRGCAFNAEIAEITGGADGQKNIGCNIVIDGTASV